MTKDNDMTYTVLRPVAFYENLVPGFLGKVFATCYEMVLKGKPLQLIATTDIGSFAAQAFLRPQEYANRSISLAGDELTFEEYRRIFQEKTGQELQTTYRFIAGIILWLVKDLGFMFKWFHDQGYGANVAELRKAYPQLQDFGTWLEKESRYVKR